MVGERIGAGRRGNINLDDDQIRLIGEIEPFHMLILKRHLVVVVQIARERRQAERREERILDGAEVGAERLGQRGQDHLHLHGTASFWYSPLPLSPLPPRQYEVSAWRIATPRMP